MTFETYRLGHLGTFSQSGIDKKSNDDEIPVKIVNYMDVFGNKRGVLRGEEFQEVTAPKGKFPYHLLRRGDVLITPSSETSDDIGHSAVVSEDMTQTAYSYHLVRFRPFRATKIIPEFSRFAFQARQVRAHLERMSKGTTRKILTRNDFTTIPFVLPDLPTQRAIADFLDRETARIDLLIEKKQRLVALLGEKAQSDVHKLFQSLDAKIWRVRHLGKVKNGAGFPVELQGDGSNEIPFFKVKHLNVNGLDQRITESEDTVTKEIAQSLRAIVFPAGTIIFAKIGAALLLGRFSMLGGRGCLDNNLAAFIVNERLVDPDYLLLCFERFHMPTMVQPGAVPSLSTERFINQSVPLPSLENQRDLVEGVRKVVQRNRKIAQAAQVSIDRLKEYRSALITAAVTGLIDVTELGKSGAADRQLDAIHAEMDA